MASFDMETLKCATCPLKPGHIVLYKEANEQMNMYHFPAVIIVSNQSFPANIPTGGEGECLKIIRVEDGQLDELAAVFLETTRPFSLSAGSVVLLHSLSHLAWVGAAAYAEDFVRCRQRICGIYKSGLSVIHGIPILQEGSKLHSLISDLSIVYDWYNTVRHTAERDILKTRKIVYNLISAASPMAAVDRGEPMAARLSTMPMAPSTPGQPMAPGSPRRDGSGQPMALLPAQSVSGQPMAPDFSGCNGVGQPMAPTAYGPGGSPMAPPSCTLMTQETAYAIFRLRLPSSLDSLKPEVFEAAFKSDHVARPKWTLLPTLL